MSDWSIEDSRELYGISRWGNSYFDINSEGEAVVYLRDTYKTIPVSLKKVVDGMRERGFALPQILRFRDLLDNRIETLNQTFAKAIEQSGYTGEYRGVYPIKVNQQQQVIEQISAFGKKYHYGLEAGSKPELIAAISYISDTQALIICNGYKDDEFIDLALHATSMGYKVFLVVEMPGEIPDIIRRSKALGVRPLLGIRFRLSTSSEGHWADSGGDRSVFGLNTSQLIDMVDFLKEQEFLDCLQLFHYHQGSQLPNIRIIREAALEAVRVYASLCHEGAPMGYLDMGGGLAVDYDGSHENSASSCNYTLAEYCTDLIEVVQEQCRTAGIPEPTIITESGRAIVAYYSVLVFNILDVTRFEDKEPQPKPRKGSAQVLFNLWEISERISEKTLQECFNDASFYLDQARAQFTHGSLDLRTRAKAEKMYWWICTLLAEQAKNMEELPDDLSDLSRILIDFYYANFSLFQSLPDSWAINQIFPFMPLHRLNERPAHRAILADITCDCDGKVDRFIDGGGDGISNFLPVHDRKAGDDYVIGAFLVGAYQETLGDLHNLLGDPHVVSIGVKNGEITYKHEIEGDTVADVLTYVEYTPRDLERRFRANAENAVQKGFITPAQLKTIMTAYRETMNGYTYYE